MILIYSLPAGGSRSRRSGVRQGMPGPSSYTLHLCRDCCRISVPLPRIGPVRTVYKSAVRLSSVGGDAAWGPRACVSDGPWRTLTCRRRCMAVMRTIQKWLLDRGAILSILRLSRCGWAIVSDRRSAVSCRCTRRCRWSAICFDAPLLNLRRGDCPGISS